MEVGALVVVDVNHPDGRLPERNPVPGRTDEHVHFILVPLPPDAPAPVQQVPGDAPQAGLGVLQPGAVQGPEGPAAQPVAHPGLGRYLRQCQVPHPQGQLLRMLQGRPAHGAHVLHAVLPVGVRRDHGAPRPLGLVQDIGEGVLHGPALPLIFLVAQDGTALQLLQLLKDRPAGRPAAIVHRHYAFRSPLQQGGGVSRQRSVRIQRRNYHNAPGQLPRFLAHIHTLPSFSFEGPNPIIAVGHTCPTARRALRKILPDSYFMSSLLSSQENNI